MKKILTNLTLLFFLLTAIMPLSAKQLKQADMENMAKQVLKKALEANGFYHKTNQTVVSNSFTKKDGETPLYTIFNFTPEGFVILSAEDNYNALLAFSTDGNIDFSAEEKNAEYHSVLNTHEERIKFVKKNDVEATPEIKKQWANLNLLNNSAKKSNLNFEIVVAPLTTTKWGQGTYYNQLLPQDDASTKDGRVNGGCVPIAMSQLVKFHNYPPKGNGYVSYNDGKYGELSADFCNTTYNWANMPDELTDYNEDVATVVSHMGISTNTGYSPVYTGTYSSYVRDALVNHFGFDNSAKHFNDVYNDFPWVARRELDAGRPLIITGGSVNNVASRHCWVVDGYGYLTDENVTDAEYYHMNWGWYGDYNGWYLDNNTYWKPIEEHIDSLETISYITERRVIYNLFPAEEACQGPNTAYVSSINDTELYLYYSNRELEENIQFRYRVAGTNEWTELPVTTSYYSYARDLTPDTTYEFEVKRTCCGNDWSDYGTTESFRTAASGQSCDLISRSRASDYAAMVGYDLEQYDLYRTYYSQDGIGYIYAFQESCNRDAPDFLYDCYGDQVMLDEELGNVSYTTLNYNDDCTAVVPVDCANNTGTFFYDQCDNGEEYYFIETDNGTIYDVYFPDSLDIEFREGTKVNFDFEFASFSSPCSIASAGAIWFTCIEYNNDGTGETTTSEIFQTYPFLTDLVDPENCTTEKIDVYVRGSYAFINIAFANDEADFYLSRDGRGTFYCSDDVNYTCSVLYRLTDDDITSSWSCGDTTTGTGTGTGTGTDPTCSSDVGDLRISSRSSSSIYMYTRQPNGATPNQFRYRPVNTSEWTYSDISDKHYKIAEDLMSGVQYEYQMRNECSPDSWSAYTKSYYFTVDGGMAKTSHILPALSKFELSNLNADNILTIYPNPASNHISITGLGEFENGAELSVSDLIGNTHINKLHNIENNLLDVNIADLPTGIYFVELKQGEQKFVEKFIKK